MTITKLLVLAPHLPGSISLDKEGNVELSDEDKVADGYDVFNHPRLRRALILKRLQEHSREVSWISFATPDKSCGDTISESFSSVHSDGLITFLRTAWKQWLDMGEEGRDVDHIPSLEGGVIPNLIPGNHALHRDPYQEPSDNVMGQIGYFCTDDCTPIFAQVYNELVVDTMLTSQAVQQALQGNVVYTIPTHPGHHAARDSFGGYCYLNQAGHAVRKFQSLLPNDDGQVAVLDIDYHCGNGTASIFYEDPSVLVVSIHCDPNYDYPFHSGFSHQRGVGKGEGTTVHIPLPPKTTWETYKRDGLQPGLQAIREFAPHAVIVSMGLDTHDGDPCTFRRAGFCLSGSDYRQMGEEIAQGVDRILPVVFVQEGGYRMEVLGEAASKVLMGFCEGRQA